MFNAEHDHDSETIDFAAPGRRREPISDKNKAARAALTAVMGQVENLHALVVPLLRRSAVAEAEAEAVAVALVDILDAMGRTKIGLLPRP